jgi:RHS repeat-associated protein
MGEGTERLQFTGHERDAGYLDYMHARYYSAADGRFLSVDPASVSTQMSQSRNRYSYSLNCPVKYLDPNGLTIAVATDEKGRIDKGAYKLLVRAAMSKGGRELISRIHREDTIVRISSSRLNSPADILNHQKQRETHRIRFGTTSSETNTQRIGDRYIIGQGPISQITVQFDTAAIMRYQPNDKSGETTFFHEMYHVEDYLAGKSGTEIALGDQPTNITGPAEQYGRSMKIEEDDLSEEEAAEWIEQQILGSRDGE